MSQHTQNYALGIKTCFKHSNTEDGLKKMSMGIKKTSIIPYV